MKDIYYCPSKDVQVNLNCLGQEHNLMALAQLLTFFCNKDTTQGKTTGQTNQIGGCDPPLCTCALRFSNDLFLPLPSSQNFLKEGTLMCGALYNRLGEDQRKCFPIAEQVHADHELEYM